MKEIVAVTIPIYKDKLNQIEIASISQCIKILGKYPIVFFAPFSLDTNVYENICFDLIQFRVERFSDIFFEDISGYNKLMLDKSFYKRFKDYKYILIYQLDAFVFSDNLIYWCKKNISYAAAPVIDSESNTGNGGMQVLLNYRKILSFLNKIGFKKIQYKRIENGGFSLRKVSSFILLLTLLKKKAAKWIDCKYNEDVFYSYWFNVFFFLWKMPDNKEALSFSFELYPRKCYELNGNKLPFGCHGFEKYEFDFWRPFMEKEGYDLKVNSES